jgi:hypothetical protein
MLEIYMNYKIGMLTFLVVVTALVTRPVFAQDSPATAAVKRLKITIGDRIVTAVVIDSETARDFLTLLPMTVRARDYVSREKYWHLPRPLAPTTERQDEYERGDIGFWIPNNDMALFYNHDGSMLPNPGLVVVAKITSGLEVFNNYPGSVTLKIELVN